MGVSEKGDRPSAEDLLYYKRIAEPEKEAVPGFLKGLEDELNAYLNGPETSGSRFVSWLAAAESILCSLMMWEEKSYADDWRHMIEKAIAGRFPVLAEPVTIAFYGTGRIAECMISVMERFAAGMKAEIVLLHTMTPTGNYFRGRKIYNISDIKKAAPDLVVVASVDFRGQILEELGRAGFPAEKTIILPDEMTEFEETDRRLFRSIVEAPRITGTDKHIWERKEKFYLHGDTWQERGVIRSFPEMAKKISGIICSSFARDSFCGIPLLKSEPECCSGLVMSLEDALISFLECREKVEFHPVRVRLDASTICQLDCAGCYMRSENCGTMGAGYVRESNVRRLLDENPWIRQIELSNSGEPFCNPEMLRILELMHERNIDTQFWNGVNFNDVPEEVLDALVRFGTSTVLVSIDGVTQGVYEQYRRKGSIDKVYANIRRINELKKKYNTEYPRMIWQFILMDHNQHEAEDAVRMAGELGMEIVFKLDWRGGFVPDDPEKLARITGLFTQDHREYALDQHHEFLSNVICSGMVIAPQINWDGRLLGCCSVYKNDWGINVFETPLSGIFNDPDYREAFINLLKGRDSLAHKGPCRDCYTFSENVTDYRYRLKLALNEPE